MAMPNHAQIHSNIKSKLRINPKVMRESVPQLTFSPSVGIIARNIDKMGMDIRSFREPLKRAVQQVIIPSIQQNFEQEGRPSWEPHSPATEEIRERLGNPVGKILRSTGALQTAMSRYNLWTVNNNAAILLDIPLWYGKLHQEGYGQGGPKVGFQERQKKIRQAIRTGRKVQNFKFSIPARPFVMIQDEDIPKIEQVFEQWLGERVNAHWSRRA